MADLDGRQRLRAPPVERPDESSVLIVATDTRHDKHRQLGFPEIQVSGYTRVASTKQNFGNPRGRWMERIPEEGDGRAERVDDDAWRHIDELIEQVSRLSREDVSEEAFYGTLLAKAVLAGAARGGFVWTIDAAKGFRIQAEHRLAEAQLLADPEARQVHAQFLRSVCEQSGVRWVTCESGDGLRLPSFGGGLLFACAIRNANQAIRIVEILQRAELSRDACQGYAEVLATLGDIAGEYHQRSRLRQPQSEQESWYRIEEFITRVHASLDTEAVAYSVANEGRRLADCDRLFVLVRRRAGMRILAVSGLDQPETRANTFRYLQRLVEHVVAGGDPLWHGQTSLELPPEVESALRDYLDLSHVRTLIVLPMIGEEAASSRAAGGAIGALVFETFDARTFDDGYRQRLATIERHGRSALRNAERYSRVPLIRWLTFLQTCSEKGHRWRYLLAAACLAALIAMACVVPADFDIVCQGKTQPLLRRQVFSPADGLVEQVSVKHAEQVEADQTLVTLGSPELMLEITQVLGEMQTVEQQLSSIMSARLGTSPATSTQRDEAARLAADEQRLQSVHQSLERQLQLLEQERDSLNVRSPIRGQVLTWDVAQRLQARPVQQGQLLMTIGDTLGPWIAELRVADKDVRSVYEAREELGRDPDVTFVLASEPGARHQGQLESVSMRIESDANQQLSALATVRIQSESVGELRPGTGVTARIHCGRRALGYVWLRDLIAAVRRGLFL